MSIQTLARTVPTAIAAPANARFQKLCAALSALCLMLAWAMPVVSAIYWAFATTQGLSVLASLGTGDIQQPLHDGQRAVGALISAFPVLLGAWSLKQARECLIGFAGVEVFTPRAVQCLRRLAMLIGGTALAAFAAVPALSLALTWQNATGARMVVVGGGVEHALVLLCATVLWLMSGVLRQGQLLAEENAAFL